MNGSHILQFMYVGNVTSFYNPVVSKSVTEVLNFNTTQAGDEALQQIHELPHRFTYSVLFCCEVRSHSAT